MKAKRVCAAAAALLVIAVTAILAASMSNLMPTPNAYAPASPAAPTAGAGTDLTEVVKSLNLPPEVLQSISKGINGVERPPGKWDIGAYQSPPALLPPANLTVK
jgi:hypothetical protein